MLPGEGSFTEGATIVPAGTVGETGYRPLAAGPGEPHLTRHDLCPPDAEPALPVSSAVGAVVLRLVHVTDFQLADPASPGRIDFLQGREGEPGWDGMFPAYRPQEFLAPQAFEAMARTVSELAGSADLVLTTGDNTDCAQHNELGAFLSMMDGGHRFHPDFGAAGDGVIPAHTVSGDFYHPEPESRDRYKREHGFPDLPGALRAAEKPFDTNGFGLPWLSCLGNHDCLAQGRTPVSPAYQRLVTGDRRPVGLPDPLPPGPPPDAYRADPTAFAHGPSVPIAPDPDRRVLAPGEYVRAHLERPGQPAGHGFGPANLDEGTGYYRYDAIPGVRVIVLDTANPAGGVTGSIDARQRDWLAESLAGVHSAYRAGDGSVVRTGNADRLVVLASHHGLSMLDNSAGGPRVLGPELEALLHRFGNVALWLVGHEHRNEVTARPGPGGGFWHVITSALCEWPCQSRLVEILAPGPDSDLLTIRCTMIDHAAPVTPTGERDLWDLASAHRELAANEPTRVGGPHSAGTPADRNTTLRLPLSPSLREALGHR